jgi:hypothetical protein
MDGSEANDDEHAHSGVAAAHATRRGEPAPTRFLHAATISLPHVQPW